MSPQVIRMLRLVWVAPASVVGLLLGGIGLSTGGGVRRVGPTLEFHGGVLCWLLGHLPVDALAITLGHVIVGRTPALLDLVREHEWVHVRQYEHWGPLFIPAYMVCSLGLWLWERDWYRGNPFEREAYEHDRRIAPGEVDPRAPRGC